MYSLLVAVSSSFVLKQLHFSVCFDGEVIRL